MRRTSLVSRLITVVPRDLLQPTIPLEELNQIEVGASEENERELEIDRLIQQKLEDDAECAIYEEIERELEIDRLVQQKLEDDAECAFYEEMACEAEIDRLVGKRTRELILERT
jgi:hypothetical protein